MGKNKKKQKLTGDDAAISKKPAVSLATPSSSKNLKWVVLIIVLAVITAFYVSPGDGASRPRRHSSPSAPQGKAKESAHSQQSKKSSDYSSGHTQKASASEVTGSMRVHAGVAKLEKEMEQEKGKKLENYYDESKGTSSRKEAELLTAIKNASIKKVISALKSGANPNCIQPKSNGALPALHLACRVANNAKGVKIVRILLAAGANPNRRREQKGPELNVAPALFYAMGLPTGATNPYSKLVVRALLTEGGAKVDHRSEGPLFRLLMVYYQNTRNKLGSATPLHWGCMVGQYDLVKELISHGADVNAPIKGVFSGYRGLHITALGAGEPQRLELTRLLLESGADPTLTTRDHQFTTLHWAVTKGGHEITRALLSFEKEKYAEALMSAKDQHGRTVLDIVRIPPLFSAVEEVLADYGDAEEVLSDEEFDPNEGDTEARQRWSSSARGGWQWTEKTDLDSSRCDFRRVHIDNITYEDFMANHYELGKPVVIYGNMTSNWRGWKRWTKAGLAKYYGDLKLNGGPVPYGRLYDRPEKMIQLKKFIRDMDKVDGSILGQKPKKDPWILFDKDVEQNNPMTFGKDYSSPSWFGRYGELELQLSVGTYGSGAPWHHHMHAWNSLLFGRKRWFLVPPSMQSAVNEGSLRGDLKETGMLSSGVQSLSWFYDHYEEVQKRGKYLFECTQGPGDVMYVPKLWSHMTMNLADTVNVAREFMNDLTWELEVIPFFEYRQSFAHSFEEMQKSQQEEHM